jgi:hypothetical protein
MNNEPYFAQYDIRITQYGSIKIERLCKTKPIFGKPEMNLNHYKIKDYRSNLRLLKMEKQSQTKPILSRATIQLLTDFLIDLLDCYPLDAVSGVVTVGLEPPAIGVNSYHAFVSLIWLDSCGIGRPEYQNDRHTQGSGDMAWSGVAAHNQSCIFQ